MDIGASEWCPEPTEDDDDEANLAEINEAIAQAEVEEFLTAQGITDVDERNGLAFEMLQQRGAYDDEDIDDARNPEFGPGTGSYFPSFPTASAVAEGGSEVGAGLSLSAPAWTMTAAEAVPWQPGPASGDTAGLLGDPIASIATLTAGFGAVSIGSSPPIVPAQDFSYGASTASIPTEDFSYASSTMPTQDFSYGASTASMPTLDFSYGSSSAALMPQGLSSAGAEGDSKYLAPSPAPCPYPAPASGVSSFLPSGATMGRGVGAGGAGQLTGGGGKQRGGNRR